MSEKIKSKLVGGSFLVSETPAKDIFTPEEFNEEQKMMRDSAKEFIDKKVWPKKEDFEHKDYKLVESLMTELGEMGMLSISVPQEYGGMGMGFVSTMLVCDYISGATGSLATAFGAHTGIGTMPITLYGNKEQKEKYLPKLASGEWFGSYCLTEPDAGSDANSGKTKAVLSEDGKHYLITGQKMWITNAGFAKLFIVFARIEDDKNITAFIIEKDKAGEGFSLGEEEQKLGIASSSTRQVFLNEVKVPVENLLGERNGGFKIAMNALNIGRIKLAAASLDGHRRALDLSIKYANERKQFKTPISSFGAIQKKIAEMAVSNFTSESGSYRAAKNIEDKIAELTAQGLSHQAAELKGVEEYAVECSILKVFASEAVQVASDEGIQIYGGMGYSKDVPMESFWRDARISRIYEGTNEINRLLSISMLVKNAFKGKLDLLTPAKAIQEEMMSIPSFDTPDYSEAMAMEKELLGKLKKVFLMVAGAALQKFGADLEKEQEFILNAADILIQIYMAESAILRAEKIIKSGSDKAKIAEAMAKIQLFESVEIVKNKATEGIVSFADGDMQLMMLSGLKRFTRYAEYPNVVALKREVARYFIEKNEYNSQF